MADRDSWVIKMKSSLEAEIRPEETHANLIHRVPKSLLRKETEVFYHPKVLSLGPYHFKGKEKEDDEMEVLKTEVARNVHLRLKDREKRNDSEKAQEKKKVDEAVESKEEEEISDEGGETGLESVIERFKKREKEIKERCYDGEFQAITGEVCAWMMARDACFVVHVLESFGQDEDEVVEERESASIDNTLSKKRYHPLMTEIVKDMFKMENQLPFWALREISSDIEKGTLVSALKNLSPIMIGDVGYNTVYGEESHLLRLLHDYIVDCQQHPASSTAPAGDHGKYTLNCTPNSHDCSLWNLIKWLFTPLRLLLKVIMVIMLLFTFLFFIVFILICRDFDASLEWESREHVLTVEELERLGVKFQKLKGKKKGIRHIQFKNRDSTLYLPQVKVDNSSEVILRNLIALEICSPDKEKPITRYAIMMNDLINTSEDVAILRREDIIINKLGNDEDIANLWNSMVPSTDMPSFKPIRQAVSDINCYRKSKWRVLWAQFIMTHCSKPWLVVSLVVGFVLVLLTIIQVVCVFESCQIK